MNGFKNEYILKVDIKRVTASPVPTFKRGDTAVLKFRIFDDGDLFDLNGFARAELIQVLPSGKAISGEAQLEDGLIVYRYSKEEMLEIGKIITSLTIYDQNNNQVSIQPFSVYMYDNIDGKTLSYIGVLQDLIAQVKTIDKQTKELLGFIEENMDVLIDTISSEQERIQNENERIEHESERILKEGERIQNELQRQQNEQNRETIFNSQIEAINNVLPNVEGLENRLSWNPTTQYFKNNIVELNGNSYQALKDNINQPPPTPPKKSNEFWSMIAQRGVDGTKLVRYEYTLYPTTENQTTFEIPLDIFDAETDSEVVVKNTVTLDPNEDYTIEGKNIVLNEPVPLNTRLTVFIYKNVPIGEEGAISGAALANGTIAFEKLDEATKNLINNKANRDELISLEQTVNEHSADIADVQNKIGILNTNTVNVKEFGAKGDGLTDDTQAFYDCISYAIENNKSVYVPKGIYILTHGKLKFNLLDNQSFVMKGDGASSVLKRKDNTVTSDGQGIFTISSNKANTGDVELVKFQDLKIDSNARNQMQPETPYGFEHCYDIRVNGLPNSRIKTVHIEGVYATDGVADHIYIAGSTDACVDNFIVNNFQCDYRARTRSDLCVTGYIKTGMFTNIKCMSLEYEFNNAKGLGDSYIFINNLETNTLDLAGAGLVCHASNIVSKKSTYFGGLKGHITSSSMTFNVGGRIVSTEGLEFNGCTFYVTEDSSGTIRPIVLQYQNTIDFKNCYFKVKSDVEVYEDALLSILPNSTGMQINIDSCEFDPKAEIAINADRCGTISVSNCKFYNYYPLVLGGSSEYTLNVTLNNLIMLGEGYSLYIWSGNITSLVINNMVCNEKNLRIKPANSACDKFGELFVDRKIIISSPLTKTLLRNDINKGNRNIYLFKGDTFVNKNSLPNEPRYWRVTKTSYAHDLDRKYLDIVTINDGVGTTDERPTCYLSPGYQYFDTTLGKTITWNGSDWVE